jgi:hypothetical protein
MMVTFVSSQQDRSKYSDRYVGWIVAAIAVAGFVITRFFS